MSRIHFILGSLVAVMVVAGCDQPFSPDGPYQEKMVVYSVLSSASDTQYVRVYTTYPPGGGPSANTVDQQVTDAVVTVTQGGQSVTFRDTTLRRPDTTRYTSDIVAYVAYNLPLVPNQSYLLTVNSPTHGEVTAEATSLYNGTFFLLNTDALATPGTAQNITVVATPGANVRGFVVRIRLEYEIRIDSTTWEDRSVEVPMQILLNAGRREYVYHSPTLTTTAGGSVPVRQNVAFATSAYRTIVSLLYDVHPIGTIHFKNAVIAMTQFDAGLFAYYSVVNGFPNSATLRLDEPDFTNIRGGLGVFGTSSEFVRTYPLPANIVL